MVSEHFISEGKVEKAPGMLRCQDREARKLTETSVMLRRGKWKQAPVGGGSLGEKGKCLAHTESAGESANGPQHELPGFVHLGPRAQLSLLLTLPVESLLVFKAQDKSHFLSEIFPLSL